MHLKVRIFLNIAPCVMSFFLLTFSSSRLFLVSFWFPLLVPHFNPSNLSFTPYPAASIQHFLLSEPFSHADSFALNATHLNFNASLFRKFFLGCFEMTDCRQISHSVIQALHTAWGSFCILNAIWKSLTEMRTP